MKSSISRSPACLGAAPANDREVAHPEVWPALETLIDPITRGDVIGSRIEQR